MISIVTAYYNRKKLFINTLESFSKSSIKDFEVIAVDDGSSDDERIEDLCDRYSFLKVVRLNPSDKWYVNPCIPFNIGFSKVSGDKIIIQNPECLHSDDLLDFVDKNLKDGDYLSFGCYSLNEIQTNTIPFISDYKKIVNNENYLPKSVSFDGDEGWYNHSSHRPNGYHFCSAITIEDLRESGGFDERFANGIAFDDDEFIHRIKLKLNVKFIDDCVSLHQWHYGNDKNSTITNIHNRKSNFWELWEKNRSLFENVTKIENKFKTN